MSRIILGNIISFIAAVLLGLSCVTGDPKRVFVYQIFQNIVLAVSSVAFGSYSAVVSLLIAALRSCLTVKGKYTKKVMLIFAAVTLVLGIAANTKGPIGILPVIASLEFVYCSWRFSENIIGLKWSLIINLCLWEIYAFNIKDYSSFAAWAVTIIATLVSLVMIKRKKTVTDTE